MSAPVAAARITELSDVVNASTGSSVCAWPIDMLAPPPTMLVSFVLVVMPVCCCRLAPLLARDVSADGVVADENCVIVADSWTTISPLP